MHCVKSTFYDAIELYHFLWMYGILEKNWLIKNRYAALFLSITGEKKKTKSLTNKLADNCRNYEYRLHMDRLDIGCFR